MVRFCIGVVVVCLLVFVAVEPSPAAPRKVRGSIESEGTTACWGAGQNLAKKGCQISGALLTPDGGLVVANDKQFKAGGKHSPVWRTILPTAAGGTPRKEEYLADAFTKSVKFEGMTCTPHGDLCFATTSFSWFEQEKPEHDPQNTLVAWKASAPGAAYIVNETADGRPPSSISLLPRMRAALASRANPAGPTWFKVEGLAALPGNRLAFGIRSVGKSFANPRMVAIVLMARYTFVKGRVHIPGAFRKIMDWDAKAVIGKDVGVSGLTYDHARARLVLLTSYEKHGEKAAAAKTTKAEHHDGWCWVLPLRRLASPFPTPSVVRDGLGKPLALHHKAEAIVALGRDRFLVLHDDDEVLGDEVIPPAHGWPRKKHEAAYTYVRLCP